VAGAVQSLIAWRSRQDQPDRSRPAHLESLGASS